MGYSGLAGAFALNNEVAGDSMCRTWAVVTPNGREQLRNMLAEVGVPQDKVEQFIYWIIENSTRPLKGGDQCQGKE